MVGPRQHKRGLLRGALTWAVALCAFALPARAWAFCGFYVTGADTSLYANATMVVLMRDGTRTVLSMQNNYQGPPDAFALVVPVPTVLTKDQVKTLPKEVFSHIDTLGAPRLVEYWEDDPCTPQSFGFGGATGSVPGAAFDAAAPYVKIEAQFAVGEYDVVILSANDSSALATWLSDNSYNIPSGAASVLAPYITAGMKFFVAKVDPTRVTFENGQAALSPLRFYYDTPNFSLPVRLGLLNSKGSQDLIVNILAPTRYEVANYPNVTVPTNLRVQNAVRDGFPGFYEALFSQVEQKNPGAVVTEYSWDSSSCDPCPTPPLSQSDLATLGADVTRGLGTDAGVPNMYVDYTLTRLHYRYASGGLDQDLVFRQADALVGGRGIPDQDGNLDTTVQTDPSGYNNFQGRYVILHPWTGSLDCASPQRGIWGGPNGSQSPTAQGAMNTALTGAPPMPSDLSMLLAQSVPSLGIDLGDASVMGDTGGLGPTTGSSGGAGGQGLTSGSSGGAGGQGLTSGNSADAGKAKTPAEDNGCSACEVGGGVDHGAGPTATAIGFGLLGLAIRRRRRRAERGC